MFVGICRMDLHFPASRSLKAKRSLVQRLKGRINQRFQASVSEVDHQDLWQRASLGVALTGGSADHVGRRLAKIRSMVEQEDLFVIGWFEDIQKFDPHDVGALPEWEHGRDESDGEWSE